MTATDPPLSTEWDRPCLHHGCMPRAVHPGTEASSHTCTQTQVMCTYRASQRARTRLGRSPKGAHPRETSTRGVLQFRSCTSTHPHTSGHRPPVPFLDHPPRSHLPGPSPSIKLQKRVSQQPAEGGRGVSAPLSPPPPHPTQPGRLCPHPMQGMGCMHFHCM